MVNYLYPLTGGFLTALSPFFNKLANTEEGSFISSLFKPQDDSFPLALNAVWCILIAISILINSVSIKYMMLSIQQNGAFLNNILNLIFNFVFSCAFDFLLDGKIINHIKLSGALLVVSGFMLIKNSKTQPIIDREEKDK